MTVKEIIQIENGNRNTIILLREGIFWRAYEKSAYAFSMQVHPYKPTRKWVIAVKQDVVSLGFPVSAAENVLNGCKVLMRQEARLVLAASPIDPDGFEVWKQTVPRSLPPAVAACCCRSCACRRFAGYGAGRFICRFIRCFTRRFCRRTVLRRACGLHPPF